MQNKHPACYPPTITEESIKLNDRNTIFELKAENFSPQQHAHTWYRVAERALYSGFIADLGISISNTTFQGRPTRIHSQSAQTFKLLSNNSVEESAEVSLREKSELSKTGD